MTLSLEMHWLSDWDDLIHGTLIFGAALPFAVAFFAGWKFPQHLWAAVALGMVAPVFWSFGWPSFPPVQSDDALVPGLATTVLLVALRRSSRRWVWAALSFLIWAALAWSLYPSWLASGSGSAKRMLISASIAGSITAWSMIFEYLLKPTSPAETKTRLSPTALILPLVTLAVLLQFGGATRFAQSSGALAAAITAVCMIVLLKPSQTQSQPLLGLFWGMLFLLLGWSGWLFADLQIGPALALLPVPFLPLLGRFMLKPSPKGWVVQGRDLAFTSVGALFVLWWGWIKYGGGDNLGY